MLLSYRFKLPGYILILSGLVCTVMYFTVKFRFEVPVFAIVSSYIETKYFTTFSTNFTDESIFLLLLSGFSLVVFSHEKDERDFFNIVRQKAIAGTIIANIFFLLFSVLFIYGSSFIGIIIINVFLPFILYLFIFNTMKLKEIRKRKLG